ncbi:unnamed protein product [Bursaphelenchus okinawaensis]|uniref:Zinc metalloproteinase n=1 Tax=Bursaphelenchus okinawaensis TaxID=465554 RepID=A0A811LQ91_9BILA|nr:unnamed protein product [Bursaphelenchus okinawaensis]CAG9127274.1 unnamed protein product [Bursaphelenchus okinawaensis]
MLKIWATLLTLYLASAQILDDTSGDLAQVRALLDEIRSESDRKFGLFFDDPDAVSKSLSQVTFDDGTEATANRAFHRELFENDIILTVPQAEAILDEIKQSNKTGRRTRQAQPGLDSFWKNNTIPYKFYYNDKDWQNLIRSALRHIESETCMRFSENGQGKDYLLYIRGSGCWSNVGRVGGRQQVSIGYGCDALGIVAHETLHALALWHEQSRDDRDKFVNIDFTKIFPGTQSNFERRTQRNSDNMGQPYDMGSVMHYGSRAFSTSYDGYSILTKDPNYQQTIGQREAISFKDAKMINLRYCQNICPRELKCQNHGYTDPNYCYRCKCPTGYGGNLCQSVPISNVPKCQGGELKAFSISRELRSPDIMAGAKCFWRIRAQKGERIQINFDKAVFPCETACSSYVELKYKKDKAPTGARICCDSPSQPIYSEDNEVLVMFVGANDIQTGYTGFEFSYKSIPGSGKEESSEEVTEEWTRPTEAPSTTKRTTEATTTEATTTTTTVPTTTTSIDLSLYTGEWSRWAAWSGCSVSCGGCGRRKRLRACYGGNQKCPGDPFEYAECGQDPCGVRPTAKSFTRCEGRLLLPCDLLKKLDFGTTRLPFTQSQDPLAPPPPPPPSSPPLSSKLLPRQTQLSGRNPRPNLEPSG